MPTEADETHPERPRCFVAYPSSPVDRAESIEQAIADIHNGGVVDIFSWKNLAVSGRLMISAICGEIKSRELFIAEVTGLNPNVLFELGYAIALKKRIWLLFNPSISRARVEWDRFQLLTTVGFVGYNNSRDIVKEFYRQSPHQNLEKNLYDDLWSTGPVSKKDALLYLQCSSTTEASMRIARRVASGPMRSVIDDPQEVRVQPFAWYVQQVTSAFAIVCHFLSTEYQNWQQNNAKHALIAGLAHGAGKPLLMLAHEPY